VIAGIISKSPSGKLEGFFVLKCSDIIFGSEPLVLLGYDTIAPGCLFITHSWSFRLVHQLPAARKIRQDILHNLEQQQAADSEVNSRLKAAASVGVRGLLLAARNLLQKFAKLNVICDSDRRCFAQICPNFTLDQWQASCRRLSQLEAQHVLQQGGLIKARLAYEDAAPWGVISVWRSSENDRARISRLEMEVTRLQNVVSATEKSLSEVGKEISSIAEGFLGGSIRPHVLRWLINEPQMGGEMIGALARFSKAIEEIWQQYAGEQFTRVSAARELAEQLCVTYAYSPAEGDALAMSLVESNG